MNFSDVQQLILQAPAGYKKQAKELLHQIENRSNELTFDSVGRLIIDGVAVPKSNIFVLLPTLFKSKHPKDLPGLIELKDKLEEMGLSPFIQSKNVRSKIGKGKVETNYSSSDSISSNQPWYYLGP